jgi:hypothetical protein
MKASLPAARTALLVGGITFAALLIRLYYVRTAIVVHPLRGDALQYFAYALNLVDHHVFSSVPPGGMAQPDSFRDPGYPAFLALMVSLFGRQQAFYLAVLDAQCALSAITVAVYAWLAHHWMGLVAAVGVGLGLALWPHLITLSGNVLSETLAGFLFAAGVLTMQITIDRASRRWAIVAGAAFAAAALTNAVLLPLAPLFAFVAAWRDRPRRPIWLALLLAATLPCAGWIIRGATLPPTLEASDRIAMNFAQGSWPEYHPSWYKAVVLKDVDASAVLFVIDKDVHRMSTQPAEGLRVIAQRMEDSPARYVAWYMSKPVELWGWAIGIGAGDIYTFPTLNSPLSGRGILRASTDIMYLASPLVMLLAAIGIGVTIVQARRQQPALLFVAVSIVFVTAVFAILQADARYAAPYRGAEFVMTAVAASRLIRLAVRIPQTGA